MEYIGDSMGKEKQVVPYEVTFYCDECNELVKFTGMIGMSNPPKYKHACKCGAIYWLDKQYPTIIYK